MFDQTLARHAFHKTDSTLSFGGIVALAEDVGVSGFRIETVAGGVTASFWDEDGRTVKAFGDTEFLARREALELFIENMES